mmetsp:Transcript_45723/g.178019  ORF Transcript_45723/g.178019 Transcript_45723/m.178019 type:complete len:192 (+) Transcript_45723:693-1268(+)
MNSCIFLAWRISKKRPNASIFMVQHFTCSRDSMQIGRLHTLFTSNLSHYDPLHFTINMVVLYNVGNEVIQIINPSRFTQLYFFGGFSSSVTSVMLKRVRRSPRVSLGASGSVMAMLFMFAQVSSAWERARRHVERNPITSVLTIAVHAFVASLRLTAVSGEKGDHCWKAHQRSRYVLGVCGCRYHGYYHGL